MKEGFKNPPRTSFEKEGGNKNEREKKRVKGRKTKGSKKLGSSRYFWIC